MSKRIVVATVAGLLAGLSCWLGGEYVLGYAHTPLQIVDTVAHRTLIGFVIGISALQMNWQLHGLLIGFIVGSPFAIGHILHFNATTLDQVIGISLFPLGAFYGWAIEAITTKLFKLPAQNR